ncbi:MAG: alanine racemase [Acidobacteria bacterium]|nr:alanine racemase [Acidobacteriota bacterium]
MRLTDLPTPQVVIERRRLERNIARMQAAVSARGTVLRPHAKTHKVPQIARWQIARGAIGICCAKLGEAEVFAEAGIEDIRLPYPVQPGSAARVLALLDRVSLSIIVDDLGVAQGWSDAMRRAGRRLDVLVKVDVGFHRCGIDPSAPAAAETIARVAALPGLSLRGLLSHAGHAYGATSDEELAGIARSEAELLISLKQRAENLGVRIDEVSVGATPTARHSVKQAGITEVRPGNYVYCDRTQVGLGAAALADCALTVVATVVSRPAADRVILDCGSKTLSSDAARGYGPMAGFGAVFTDLGSDGVDDDLLVERLSEEHATVRVRSGSTRLAIGDRVRVLPNHACVVSNLVDCVRLVDGDEVVETLTVAARGRIS